MERKNYYYITLQDNKFKKFAGLSYRGEKIFIYEMINKPLEQTMFAEPIKNKFGFYTNSDDCKHGDVIGLPTFYSERLFLLLKKYFNPKYISFQEIYIKELGVEYLYYYIHQLNEIRDDIKTEFYSESYDEVIMRSGGIDVSEEVKKEIIKNKFNKNVKFIQYKPEFDINKKYKKEL